MPRPDRPDPGKAKTARSEASGHRRRLRERFLKDDGAAFHDYELLELLLFGAMPRVDTKAIAKALLKRFGGFGGVVSAAPRELREVPGVGDAAIVALKSARAVALRLARAEAMEQPVLASWDRVLAYCRGGALAHEKTERFHLLFLDRKHQLIADEVHQTGTVDHTPVYPREVVKRALDLGASALILVHNHPSGDPTPSRADIDLTRELVASAGSLGISIHDHLIIGRSGHVSMRGQGLM